MIQRKVTTVVCMCDPIAPVFGTKGFTAQSYFPEILGAGTQFTDYDLIGRLYDPQQMAHAFGPSLLADFAPFDQQDQSKVWHATGHTGKLPCNTCGVVWSYFSLAGTMIQRAGPTLNAANIERGTLSLPPRGGERFHPLLKFGPGDYTGLDDAREVYWDANARSAIDGQAGAYVSLDNGRRTPVGGFGPEFRIPVPSS
jgi:hypothetical protein